MALTDCYVKPHAKVSREVTFADLERVNKEAQVMHELCKLSYGLHKMGALAIAHSQIEDVDPLRFFVMLDGMVVINPTIISSLGRDSSVEGCLSYPERGTTGVIRSHKITVRLQILEDGKMFDRVRTYANLKAYIFQHEIDHLEGKYIYPL